MAKVIVQNDPTGISGKEIYDCKTCPTFAIRDLAPHFEMDSFDVFLNKMPLELPQVENGVMVNNGSSELYMPMLDDDVLHIINRPKGFDPITVAIIAVSVAAATVTVALLSKPKIPGDQGVVKNSPNNNLEAQTNIARRYQAIPDIFGEPIPYPDLSGEAEQEYVQQSGGSVDLSALKVVKQLMVVTVGTYFETDVFSGDTAIANFGGSYTMHRPNASKETIVPLVTETFSISEVNQQELFGSNEVPVSYTYNNTASAPNTSQYIALNSQLTVDLSDYPGFSPPPTQYPRGGTLRIIGDDGAGSPRSFDGQVTFSAVFFNSPPGSTTLSISEFIGAPVPSDIFNITTLEIEINESIFVGPFNLPVTSDEVWIDIIFDRGLKGTAEFTLQYSPNQSGPWFDISFWTYTADSFNQQFFTRKHIFGSPTDGWVRVRRDNFASEDANEPSLAKLERIASIVKTANKNYGNVTLIEVEVPASRDVSNLRENQINLRGNRHVISYDRNTGQVDYTLRASRLGADHILHEWVEVFEKDPALLDLEEMYEVWDNLPDPRLGYFDYTFDDLDVPLGERVQSIANAARVYAFQDSGIWRFKRDEAQTVKETLLTRRDIRPRGQRSFTYNYSPRLNGSNDSVQVEFVNPENNKTKYITRRLENGVIVDGVGASPSIIQMPYVKEEYNAINRAELEIRKLIYLRETFTDSFAQQGMLVEKGDLIAYEEVYNKSMGGGDIRRVDGLTAYTSEIIDFSIGTLYVEYTDINGDVIGPYEIQAGPTAKSFTLVTGDLDDVYLAGNDDIQRPSQYRVSTLENLDKLKYVVQEKKPASDGRSVDLTFTTYDDRVFEFDNV